MGIRFFCPNGHYLNVKSEYAGKVAFCKECKVQMRVPMASMVEKGVKVYSPGMPTAERLEDVQLGAPSQRGVAPTQVASVAELVGNPDPIWEVIAPSSPSPYGPANGAELLEWIRQRRVGPETWVRRVDWKSKIEAKEVLPRDVFEQAKTDVADYPETTGAIGGFGETSPASSLSIGITAETNGATFDLDEALRRHKNASRLFYVVCSLVVALAVLAIILLAVLLKNRA